MKLLLLGNLLGCCCLSLMGKLLNPPLPDSFLGGTFILTRDTCLVGVGLGLTVVVVVLGGGGGGGGGGGVVLKFVFQ